MTYTIPFADLTRTKPGPAPTALPPAADILDSVRRGTSYAELAAIHGVSASTLRRRVQDSGLVRKRRHHSMPPLVPLVEETPAWMERGLCAQTDPDAFFPEKCASSKAAKRTCAACPVMTECLTYALEHDERFGVWGGMTPGQRQRMLKAAKS